MTAVTHTGDPVTQGELGPRTSSRPRRRRDVRAWLVLRAWQVATLLALLGLWMLVSTYELLDPVISRTPSQVVAYLVEAWGTGELQHNTLATMQAVLLAFVIASAVGIVVGVGLGLMPRVEAVLTPFLDAANAMPRIALAPVFIVWLGIGIEAKVALAFSVVVFIVLANALAGVRSADAEILRMSTVFGISKLQMFTKVLLPVAVPSIFAGLRLGLVYSLLGVVGSEIIASQEGLGQLIAFYSGQYKLEAVYGILLVLAAVAAVLNLAMVVVERRLLRWQAPKDS